MGKNRKKKILGGSSIKSVDADNRIMSLYKKGNSPIMIALCLEISINDVNAVLEYNKKVTKANLLLKEKKYAEIEKMMWEILADYPEHGRLIVILIKSFFYRGNNYRNLTLEMCSDALSTLTVSEDRIDLYLIVTQCLINDKMYDDALIIITKALNEFSDNSALIYKYMVVQCLLQNYEEGYNLGMGYLAGAYNKKIDDYCKFLKEMMRPKVLVRKLVYGNKPTFRSVNSFPDKPGRVVCSYNPKNNRI